MNQIVDLLFLKVFLNITVLILLKGVSVCELMLVLIVLFFLFQVGNVVKMPGSSLVPSPGRLSIVFWLLYCY